MLPEWALSAVHSPPCLDLSFIPLLPLVRQKLRHLVLLRLCAVRSRR